MRGSNKGMGIERGKQNGKERKGNGKGEREREGEKQQRGKRKQI